MVFGWFTSSSKEEESNNNNNTSNNNNNNNNEPKSNPKSQNENSSYIINSEQIENKKDVYNLTADEYFWKYAQVMNVSCQHTHTLLSLFSRLKQSSYAQLKGLDEKFLSSLHIGCIASQMDERARRCLPSTETIREFLEVNEVLADRDLNPKHSYENEGRHIHQQIDKCLSQDVGTIQALGEIQDKSDQCISENRTVPRYLKQSLYLAQEKNRLLLEPDDTPADISSKHLRCSQSLCRPEVEQYSKCQERERQRLYSSSSSPDLSAPNIRRVLSERCYIELQQMVMCNFSILCASPLEDCVSRMTMAYQENDKELPSDTEMFQKCFDNDRQFQSCTSRIASSEKLETNKK